VKQNYYRIMGLSRHSTPAEIRQRYRYLARKLHPDVNPSTDRTHFQALQEAYGVLSNPEARRKYDMRLAYQSNTTARPTQRRKQPKRPPSADPFASRKPFKLLESVLVGSLFLIGFCGLAMGILHLWEVGYRQESDANGVIFGMVFLSILTLGWRAMRQN
jgi:curved DNA-binding protein CbpA